MQFNLSRFFQLIRRDYIVHKKSIGSLILVMFAFCGVAMLMVSDVSRNGDRLANLPPDAGEIVYGGLLLLLGSLFTIWIFRIFRSSTQKLQYLSLPASNFEKVLSRWCYSLPGYVILASIIFIISYFFFGYLIESFSDLRFAPLSDMSSKFLSYYLLAFFIVHSVLFLMATSYDKYVIPKSILTGIGLVLVTFFIVGLIFRIVFFDYFDGFYTPNKQQSNIVLSEGFKDTVESIAFNAHYIIACTLVPFLWVVSYFKIKEKEA